MVIRAAFAILLLILAAHGETTAGPVADGRSHYAPLLIDEALRRGIPPALADAVATVESAYDPQARGTSGEVGLMQVLPSTASMLGFRGDLMQLAEPATNIRFGVQYLAGAWVATGGRLCDTLTKYRAGYGATTMSLRSAIYCRRAINYLASINSPLATGPGTEIPSNLPDIMVTDAVVGNRPSYAAPIILTRDEQIRMRRGQRTAEDSRRYWIAWESHISELRNQMESRRRVRLSTRAQNAAKSPASLMEVPGRALSVAGSTRPRPNDVSGKYRLKVTTGLTRR